MSLNIEKQIKVRYAPSPTGIPHIGNIRTALFDYFFAKATGGEFILRLEDTDQARKVEGAEELIKESLLWLGANWDKYAVQSERVEQYEKCAKELIDRGLAGEDNGAVRFIVPKEKGGNISWEDAIGKRTISFESDEIEDFIILKADGYPTYHLANVVDDHLMGVTHVIRGDDWISSTPKHILLYEAFGWEIPVFAHVPNVMGEDGKKLSKRRGAKSVLEFRADGYLPEALVNYLMLLGWSPKDDKTILSREQIIEEFTLDRVNVAPAIFSEQKLEWMNGEYIRALSNIELKKRLLDFDENISEFDQDLVLKLIEPAKTRMKKLGDFKKMVTPFLIKQDLKENKIRDNLHIALSKLDDWNKERMVNELKKFVSEQNIKFQDLYEAVIGERQGLPLGDVFELLGKEKILALLTP